MSIEAFQQAQKVMRALQSNEYFEHFGMDSRGIRVQTRPLIYGIASISAANPDLQEPITLIGALIQAVSEDYGTYIRVKGASAPSVHIRRAVGPLSDEMSLGDLAKVALRRSGVEVNFAPDGNSRIWANSAYLETASGQTIAEVINEGILKLTEEQRDRLAGRLIAVVTQEVAQSGEFVDLG